MSVRKRLFFGLLLAATALTGLELVLRLHDFNFYFNFGADLLGMPLLDLHSIRRVQNNTVEFDPQLFWRFKPNQVLDAHGIYRRPVRINAHGFRGPDFEDQKPPRTFRVACLGDSTTFGWSVADDETFPAQLAPLLQRACPARRVETLNLGVTGYTSCQGRVLMERSVVNWRPDLVIFAFGPNDRLPALKSDREHQANRTWDIGPVTLFLSHFQLYKLLKAGVVYLENRGRGLSLDPKTYIPRLRRKVSPDEYADNLRAVKALCDRIGADLIIIAVDYPSLPPDQVDRELRRQARETGAAMPPDWKPWNQAAQVRALGAEMSVPCLDLRQLFDARLRDYADGAATLAPDQKTITDADREPWRRLMIDNGHPNRFGHALIAENLAAIVRGLPAFQRACPEPR
jgi:lysophospholipase L1-like esterase